MQRYFVYGVLSYPLPLSPAAKRKNREAHDSTRNIKLSCPIPTTTLKLNKRRKAIGRKRPKLQSNLLLVRTLNRFGTQSQLIADYSDPIIPSAMWQLKDRIKSSPYFSYKRSKVNPWSTYCQKKILFVSYFFPNYLKYSSFDICWAPLWPPIDPCPPPWPPCPPCPPCP